jgi:hypothetical protein
MVDHTVKAYDKELDALDAGSPKWAASRKRW